VRTNGTVVVVVSLFLESKTEIQKSGTFKGLELSSSSPVSTIVMQRPSRSAVHKQTNWTSTMTLSCMRP